MTTVAAIVCAHTLDRWHDITQALTSVQEQSRSADEIILAVDNNHELFVKATETFSSFAKVVQNTGPQGVSPTRNAAAAATSCEVLAYLDDDASADPAWIQKLLAWYSDPAVVGVGGLALPAWEGGQQPSWFPPSFLWVVGCSHVGVPTTAGEVRNFIGCNMSIRRSAWSQVGGFCNDLGRVGSNGGGGDETEFCLRVLEQVGGLIIHEPEAIVTHRVPASRQSLRYFTKRCYNEGLSKGQITARSGASRALSEERSHLVSTLPREFLLGTREGVLGDPGGLFRSAAILMGTAATGVGFVRGRPHDSQRAMRKGPQEFVPAQVATIDLTGPTDIFQLDQQKRLFALVRSGRDVLGVVRHDAPSSSLAPPSAPPASEADPSRTDRPTIAVVIASRDRTESLRRCLRSLSNSTVVPDQLIVVDSAPSDEQTKELIEACNEAGDTDISYVRSTKPGLAIAHNAALEHVTSELIAFTDDDVLVDRYWLDHILAGFATHPDVACVTGGIMPAELETWPQQWAEDASRFNKGFVPLVFDNAENRPASDPLFPFTAGSMGSGANMAFVTSWLQKTGGFRPQLGAGTVALGGDDLRAFYNVIKTGQKLVYNPSAVVFHHHHRTAEEIERQSFGYGAGLTAFLASVVHDEPAVLLQMLRQAPRGATRAFNVSKPAEVHSYPGQSRRTRRHRWGMLSGPVLYARSARRK